MKPIAAFALVVAALAVGNAQAPSVSIRVDAGQVLKDVQILAADDMEGRLAGAPGGERARAYVASRLAAIGVEPVAGGFERPFTFGARDGGGDRRGVNLVGIIRGTASPDRFIVVTAHYDHIGVRGGEVFNGADDNASGVAGLLALAAHFKAAPPRHSLLIAALDAEEAGIQGARALLRDPPVPVAAMALNVNMDMIGRDPRNVLYASGTSHYPFLKPYLEDVAQPPVTLVLGHDVSGGRRNTVDEDWTGDSDHAAFHREQIPFVYFGVEDFDQHHKATDDPGTIGGPFLAGAAATVIAAVQQFDAHLDEIAAATTRR
jgi:Zn-dependent M28 family amino/carboxypeptidase